MIVWKKKDLAPITAGKFMATVAVHDTLLLRLSPSSLKLPWRPHEPDSPV
jgi:hypothetical protein